MDREVLDLLRRQHAAVQPQIVNLADEWFAELLAADSQRRIGRNPSGEGVAHDLGIEPRTIQVQGKAGGLPGTVVGQRHVVPVTERQPLSGANLDGVVGGITRDAYLEARRPFLDPDERDIVKLPFVTATTIGALDFLEDRDRQVPAAFQPHGEAEGVAAIEPGDIAEAHLGVAVERRGPSHASRIKRRVSQDCPSMLVPSGHIREVAVELVVRNQARHIRLGRFLGDDLFPRALQRSEDFVFKGGIARRNRGVQFVQPRLLVGSRQRQHRHGIAGPSIEPDLRNVVEECEELVELLVGDGIELVRMAARAAHGEPHERVRGGFDPIDDVFDLVFVGDRAALEVDHVIAIEARRDLLIARGIGQQVAGKLLDRELVVRHVLIEGVDHPVAPRPHPAQAVDVIAVRVGVAGRVEPGHGHALAVVRRTQQPIDLLFVRVRRLVRQKRVGLRWSRRQPGEIVGQPPQERLLVRLGRRLETLAFEPRQDESIDRVSHPRALDRGELRALWRDVRPVRIPFRAFVDPAAQKLDLLLGQAVPGVGRGHPILRIRFRDLLNQQAV